MRLLLLSPIGNIGGAERVLLTAIAGVKREWPDTVIRVLALSDGPLLPAVRELGAEAEVLPLGSVAGGLGDSQLRGGGWLGKLSLATRSLVRLPALGSFVGRLRSAVMQFDPDLVHSNGVKTHLLASFALPRRVPVVWHIHDFYSLRPAARWLLRVRSSRARAGIAVSRAVADDARCVLPAGRIVVVPNAVDLTRFSPGPGDGTELDRRAGLPPAPPETVRVGLVATYARWKGHLNFLDAAAQLRTVRNASPVRWYIVGGPIYHTAAQFTEVELREEVARRGLTDRVGFVPFTSDPVPVYRALDIVVHASTLPEPFGLTVAEAMACGRTVVVSAAGGANELFTHDWDAVGVAPGSCVSLAGTIRELLLNPLRRVNFGENARNAAEQRFDANLYGARLCAVYRNVLKQRGR